MDWVEAKEISKLADKQIKNAEAYEEARHKAADAKVKLDLLLVAELPQIRAVKKNAGVDMAILMLMEKSEVARGLYKEFVEWEAKYKGLEILIEAYATKITLAQSQMKYLGTGEKFGHG